MLAENVWDVSPDRKSNKQIAEDGLAEMEKWMRKWMREIGVVMNISEFGVKDSDINQLAELTLPMDCGYKPIDKDEVTAIFRASLKKL